MRREWRGGGGVKYCYNILVHPTSCQILFDCFNHNHSYTTSYDQGDGGGGGGERRFKR